MKMFVNTMLDMIRQQITPGRTNLLRIEGVETPIVYQIICKQLNALWPGALIARLSKERYDQYVSCNRSDWQMALRYLETEELIDVDGAMTSIRNQAGNDVSDSTRIYLLMGTEVVQDKGGLKDFTCISTAELVRTLSSNYSLWFEPLFHKCGFDEIYLRTIRLVYSTVFADESLDALRLSRFVDELADMQFSSERELISYIYETLNQYWNIPTIRSRIAYQPTEKSRMIGIISNAHAFINRKESFVAKLKEDKLREQLAKYAEAKNVPVDSPFPLEGQVFQSFDAFSTALIDFVKGRNFAYLRSRFLQLDFGIIVDILGIKDSTKAAKRSTVTVHGEPLVVFGQMVLGAVQKYLLSKKAHPKEIVIALDEVRLSQCDKEIDGSIERAFSELIMPLGGIVRFLNKAGLYTDDNEIRIQYLDDQDPFTDGGYWNRFSSLIKSTRNWDDMCRIDFKVTAAGDCEECYAYRWIFSPNAHWKKSFTILSNNTADSDDEFYVPSLLTSTNLESYIDCEDSEEFCAQLESIDTQNCYSAHHNKIRRCFDKDEASEQFGLCCDCFAKWSEKLLREGFYNAMDQARDLVKVYGEMIRWSINVYSRMHQNERDHLYLIADSFVITSNTRILEQSDLKSVVVPAYHPLTLEKMLAQAEYMARGCQEIIGSLTDRRAVSAKVDNLVQMSMIVSSMDALLSSGREYLVCRQMHGYHGIYLPHQLPDAPFAGKNGLENVVSDEEDDGQGSPLPPSARILMRNILDYVHTFPARLDGLTVSLINPIDMKHIVVAIREIGKQFEEEGAEAVINLNIICVNSQKNSSGYLKHWLDSYFAEERKIKVNTYLRYVFSATSKQVEGLRDMLSGTDICFVYDLLNVQNVEFRRSAHLNAGDGIEVQFPMVCMPETISASMGTRRSISNSQFQFACTKDYTQLIHIMGYPNDEGGEYRSIRSLVLPDSMSAILREVHQTAKWTVCIDKAIDKQLINDSESKIIGFSTGEGEHGDMNVTVSASIDILDDIERLLKNKLFERFPNWSQERVKDAARHCIGYSKRLDGIRVLKALNPNDYEIHSYLAYILTQQHLGMSNCDSGYVLRAMINIDAYKHWFDQNGIGAVTDSDSRPDLLLLEIPMTPENLSESDKLYIDARLIECKMGNESQKQLEDACEQVVHGCEVLSHRWNPDSDSVSRRYWYNQLYRAIVFSPLTLKDNQPEYQVIEQKLRGILNGNFEVRWSCSVFAYWLDSDSVDLKSGPVAYKGFDIEINTAGQLYIQRMLVPSENRTENFAFNTIQTETDGDEAAPDEGLVSRTQEDATRVTITVDAVPVPERASEKPTVEQISMPEPPMSEHEVKPAPRHESSTSVERDLASVRLLLGRDLRTGDPYYWEFGNPGLNNRHLLINGNSGCGKTYAIQTLLVEQASRGISSVIFDYTAGFTPSKLDPAFKSALGGRIQQRIVRSQKIPVNPFIKHDIKIDEGLFIPEEDSDVATKIANIFQKVYSFGDQQKSLIYRAVMSGLRKYGDRMDFKCLTAEIEEQGGNTAEKVLSKISAFIDLDPFATGESFDWEDIRDSDGMVYVIQLTGYSPDIKILLTEILLWEIWSFCEKTGDETKPFTVVLDEAQNLDHSAESPSAKILTEGRKFGLSGWYATQFMKPQLSDDEIQRLQQAGQKLYFCPPDEGVMTVARNIDISSQGSKEWAEKLKKLKKGECVTCGGMVRGEKWARYDPHIIKISSFQERLGDVY